MYYFKILGTILRIFGVVKLRLLTIISSIEKDNGIKLPNELSIMKSYIKNYMMVGKLLNNKDKLKKK